VNASSEARDQRATPYSALRDRREREREREREKNKKKDKKDFPLRAPVAL